MGQIYIFFVSLPDVYKRQDNDHLSYGPLPLGQEYVIIGDGHVEQNPVAIDGRRRIDPARALGAVGIERLRSLSLECAAKSQMCIRDRRYASRRPIR